MARDATARLYDVHKQSVVLKKFDAAKKYDHGTITFRAKRGKLIDLDKLYESLRATRLSGSTSSGLVSFEVTVVGEVVVKPQETVLEVAGSKARFVLGSSGEEAHKNKLAELRSEATEGKKMVRVTGRLHGWAGRWPEVLRRAPRKPPRILVTNFQTDGQR